MELRTGKGYFEVIAASGEVAFLLLEFGNRLTLFPTKLELFQRQRKLMLSEMNRFVGNVEGKRAAVKKVIELDKLILDEENIPLDYGNEAKF